MNGLRMTILLALALSNASNSAQTYPSPPATPSKSSAYSTPVPSVVICPWLTEGSAARGLAGDVLVVVNAASSNEGSCTFTNRLIPQDYLQIVVSRAGVAVCPPGSTKLAGVGTQANICQLPSPPSVIVERVSFKVRDTNLVITLATRTTLSPKKSVAPYTKPQIETSAEIAQQLAEQVAGNVF